MSKKKKTLITILIIILIIILLLIILNKKEKVYTISLQNGKEIVALVTDKYGMIEEPEEPTKEGYIFLGWYIGNEKVDFSKPFIEDKIIVAKWGVDDEKTGTEVIQPEIEELVKTEETQEKEQQQIEKPVTSKPQIIPQPSIPQKPQLPEVLDKENDKQEDNENKEEEKTDEGKEESQIIEVTKVILSSTTLNLEVGQNSKLIATINPSNATNKTTSWKSSDNSIATVDANGQVTAVGVGTAIITVTSGEKTATCIVTVKNKVTYSVEWVKLEGSAIEQYKLYIKSSEGEYVSGTLKLTTIAGATFEESVTENGSMNAYVKSAIKTVKII